MKKRVKDIIAWVNGEWMGSAEDVEKTIESVVIDSRNVTASSLFVPLIGENTDGHLFAGDAIRKGAICSFWKKNHLIDKSIGLPLILVNDPLEALQIIAARYREEIQCKVVAITGSNGKTTTKDLISSVLSSKYQVHATKGNLNNHIGVPLTLLSMPANTEIAVIEMGMNHFGEIEQLSKIAKPDLAVITNIGESHIEFLGSRAGIAKAKLEIIAGMNDQGVLFYPGDENLIESSPAFSDFKGRKIPCGFSDKNLIYADLIANLELDGMILFEHYTDQQYTISVPGQHNAQNALYAIGVGTLLQLLPSEIQSGLLQASLTKMRLEKLSGRNGVTLINDAYNASPTSIKAALHFFHQLSGWKHKIVVLGDVGELGSRAQVMHEEIGQELDPSKFPLVFVTGELSKHIVVGANQKGYNQVVHFSKKEDLIKELEKYLQADNIILFKASRFMKLDEVVQVLI